MYFLLNDKKMCYFRGIYDVGFDKIRKFWLKYLVALYGQSISGYNEIMNHPINILDWLTKRNYLFAAKITGYFATEE